MRRGFSFLWVVLTGIIAAVVALRRTRQGFPPSCRRAGRCRRITTKPHFLRVRLFGLLFLLFLVFLLRQDIPASDGWGAVVLAAAGSTRHAAAVARGCMPGGRATTVPTPT